MSKRTVSIAASAALLFCLTFAVAADASSRLIATKTVRAQVGGWVSASNGVGVYVPPGAMSRNGRVTIRQRGNRRFNIHIHVPWNGEVAVRLPQASRNGGVAHRIGPVWLSEAKRAGNMRNVYWVSSLSWFTDKARSLAAAKACLTRDKRKLVLCLIERGIERLSSEVASQVARRISESCVAYVTGFPDIVPSMLLDDACVGTASAPGLPQPPSTLSVTNNPGGSQTETYNPQGSRPAPSTPPVAASPAPASNPTPASASAPAAGPAPGGPGVRGFTIQDVYFGGTWARNDPYNGTWYSSGNRPSNAAYWYPNGLGVGVDCARSAAAYTVVFAGGRRETWDTWFRVTDGRWFPSAAAAETGANSTYGLPGC